MVSKERFVKDIEAIKNAFDYQDGLNQFLKTFHADGYLYQPDCSLALLSHLHEEFGEADQEDVITYFCYDLEFGKKWKAGMLKDKKYLNADLSSAENLYDFLTSCL